MEKSEEIDDKKLLEVAKVLGVTPEAIKNFSEDAVFNFFNSFNDAEFHNGSGVFGNTGCNFNPLDKVVELYEWLVKAEKDKVIYLEKLMDKKK